jgi:predicted nucleotidyltransferase
MDTHDDAILNLWRNLSEAGVEYIMIGGFAVNIHGFSRFTADVDILIHDTIENRKKFRQALKNAEIGDFNLIETMEIIPRYTTILLDNGMELDIFTSIPGYETGAFAELYKTALQTVIEGISVPFLHLNQLLHSKRISNRPKDIIDIEELEKIQNTKDKSN